MNKILTVLCSIAALALSACSGSGQQPLDVLRIGVLPDQNKETLEKRYASLLQRLEQKTSLKVELVIPDSYNKLLALFQENKVQLAYFGGATFVKAQKSSRAVPLVMREVDTRFTTYFIVPANNSGGSLRDYKDKIISFGSELSTSGHFMPRYFLNEKGINPETFFSEVRFSGAHDQTAFLVRDQKVAIGAANSQVIDTLFRQGLLKKGEVRILWETPPYPDYVWAVQHSLSEELRQTIRWAFLELRKHTQADRVILEALGTDGILPARSSDFHALEKVIDSTKPT